MNPVQSALGAGIGHGVSGGSGNGGGMRNGVEPVRIGTHDNETLRAVYNKQLTPPDSPSLALQSDSHSVIHISHATPSATTAASAAASSSTSAFNDVNRRLSSASFSSSSSFIHLCFGLFHRRGSWFGLALAALLLVYIASYPIQRSAWNVGGMDGSTSLIQGWGGWYGSDSGNGGESMQRKMQQALDEATQTLNVLLSQQQSSSSSSLTSHQLPCPACDCSSPGSTVATLSSTDSSSSSLIIPPTVIPSTFTHRHMFLFPQGSNSFIMPTDSNQIATTDAASSSSSQPYPRVFLTSKPNHGAGLGHQFGEWIMGPYLAMRLNATYLHTGFLIQSARWNSFTGFGFGEPTLEDLPNYLAEEEPAYLMQDPRRRQNTLSKEVRALRKQIADLVEKEDVRNRKGLVVVYERIHTPDLAIGCYPPLNLLLRQKYCAARVANPLTKKEDLYAEDRAAGRTIIAVHYRCGNSCFSSYRSTSRLSILMTLTQIRDAIMQHVGAVDNMVVHFFAQPPSERHNITTDEHFSPLFNDERLGGLRIVPHFDTSATQTFHHLVTSDILIGSQSSFSWLAFLLHHSLNIGPMHSCRWKVKYDKKTGEVDTNAIMAHFQQAKEERPKFDSIQDCLNLKPLD